MIKRKQTGKSMIEMLAVLAVIGVLSIIALAGFTYAMNKHRANGTIFDIMLRGSNVPMIDENYIQKPAGYEFTFAYSQQSRYLNISREELPDHLEIIGPGDELFFLTPRLNEFPILDTTQDILIPAQYPYSEEWGILSLASLLKSLTNESESGSGTYFHDQLLNLDKANQHPIKAISGLQAALDKKVSLSVYEQFVQTYNNHVLSAAHLTNEQQSILSRFSIVDGRLQIDGDAYTTGWLAQLGVATGEGGTGGSGTMYHGAAGIRRIEAITGLQDALNGKASADHVHSWASLTDKPTTLSGFGITDGVDKDSFDTHVRAFAVEIAALQVREGSPDGLHLADRCHLTNLVVHKLGNVDGDVSTVALRPTFLPQVSGHFSHLVHFFCQGRASF